MSEETPTTTAQESAPNPSPQKGLTAREKAEARRRRILEKSKDRLNVVYGAPLSQTASSASVPSPDGEEHPSPADAPETVAEKEEEAVEQPSVAEEVSKSDGAETTQEEEAPNANAPDDSVVSPTKVSSNARLAQMRRRYKKIAVENVAKEGDGELEDKESADVVDEVRGTQGGKEVKDISVTKGEEESPVQDKASSGGEKKQYMGVAKMRRKLAAEKKKNEEAVIEEELKELETKIPKLLHPSPIALGPILIQLFTVCFLFFAGFDVGIQNHAIVKQETPHVHMNLCYVDHGIGIKKIFGRGESSQSQDALSGLSLGSNLAGLGQEEEEDDEFGDTKSKPLGASSQPKNMEGNLDPIFGVDFDKLTTGDGFFFTAARFAVWVHRTLTYFFYLLPLSVLYSILSVPKKLIGNPPVFFLCAVIIRYIGKHVLGGNVPNLDEMIEAEVKADKDENEKPDIASTDFVSMGKNFISNFLKGNFPKLVMVFTIMKDARSDMFIILCGFFVGLIAPTSLLRSTITSEEL